MKAKNRGFLLVEVMISVLIIISGIIYVARSFYSSKNSFQKSREMLVSSLLLEDKMWGFEEKREIGEGGKGGGFPDNADYEWKIEARDMEETGLELVTLKVFQKKDPKKTAYSINTILMKKTE